MLWKHAQEKLPPFRSICCAIVPPPLRSTWTHSGAPVSVPWSIICDPMRAMPRSVPEHMETDFHAMSSPGQSYPSPSLLDFACLRRKSHPKVSPTKLSALGSLALDKFIRSFLPARDLFAPQLPPSGIRTRTIMVVNFYARLALTLDFSHSLMPSPVTGGDPGNILRLVGDRDPVKSWGASVTIGRACQ